MNYMHLGSTIEEVRSIFGEPSRTDSRVWTYGTSHIKFDEMGKVVAWKNMFNELSKGLQPYSPNDKTFFLGSTRQEVLEALGSPTAIMDTYESEWKYESSHVKFDRHGLVSEWKGVYGQLAHGFIQSIPDSGYLKMGITKEDVLKILGSPNMILALDSDVWHYEASHVKFYKGIVIEWKSQYGQLMKGLLQGDQSGDYLQIGMSREAVRRILGSPLTVLASNPNIWKYDASHVRFDPMLVEWKNMFGQLDHGMKKPQYKDYIRIGLDKASILDIFGSPTTINKLNPDIWLYNSSHIKFKHDKVVEWRNMFHDFDRGMKHGDGSADDIGIGVTEADVLNCLGSPTSIFELEPNTWHYGNASVYFDNGKVTSWMNIDDIKLRIQRE